MKVRMIQGFYQNPATPSDYFLAPLSFPMKEQRYAEPDGLEDVTIENEQQLEQWADEEFREHNIWDMEVPDPLIHAVVLDRTGTAGAEIDYVGAFYDHTQADEAARETAARAFGDPVRIHLVPFAGLEEWREDAASRGVLGDDEAHDPTTTPDDPKGGPR